MTITFFFTTWWFSLRFYELNENKNSVVNLIIKTVISFYARSKHSNIDKNIINVFYSLSQIMLRY